MLRKYVLTAACSIILVLFGNAFHDNSLKAGGTFFSVTHDAGEFYTRTTGTYTITYTDVVVGGGPPTGFFTINCSATSPNWQNSSRFITSVKKNGVEIFHGNFDSSSPTSSSFYASEGDVIEVMVGVDIIPGFEPPASYPSYYRGSGIVELSY